MKNRSLIGWSLIAGATCLALFLGPGTSPDPEPVAHLPQGAETASAAFPIDETETHSAASSTETYHWNRLLAAEAIATETTSLSDTLVKHVVLTHDDTEGFPVRLVEHRETDPQTGQSESAQRQAMVGDRVMLSVYSRDDYEALAEFALARDYTLSEMLDFSPVVVLRAPEADIGTVPAILDELKENLPFLTAEPDYILYPASIPNDPLLGQQWGLQAIDAFGAWEVETGSPEVYVAVLDTGIDRYHVDLQANIAHDLGRNFSTLRPSGDDNFDDVHSQSHGTRVSGIIGAVGDNATGIAGVSWRGSVIPIRVGQSSFPTSNIIRGLDYVTDLRLNQGIPVVVTNNSYGATSLDNLEGLRAAVVRSAEAGILFVAAAGNSGINMDTGSRFFPASFDIENVIAVASTNTFDSLTGSSNYGSEIVHLGAPGEGIYTTSANNVYTTVSGTSFAAPFVSGVLGLMASVNPELTMLELKETLLNTVDPLPSLQGRTITGGRLNAGLAVSTADRIALLWDSPAAGFLNLPAGDTALRLEIRGERAGNPVILTPERLDWETISGPAAVDFSSTGNTTALAGFPVAGEYRLRAEYQDDDRIYHSKPITVIVGPSPESPGDGLAAHWTFDEEDGPQIIDLSGQDRHGVLESATRDVGLFGNALRFNGDNSRATVSAPGVAQVTFSAWVKSDSRGHSDITLPRILETEEHTLFWGRIAGQEPNNNTVKFVAHRQDATMGVWYTEPGSVDDHQWYHIAVGYDGSSAGNDPEIHIDGHAVPVFRQVETTEARPEDSDSPAWLGNSPDLDRAWDGLIDEVRFFQRTLDSGEISALAYRSPTISLQFEEPLQVLQPNILTASLQATPENPTQLLWETISGPGEVTFDDPWNDTVTARFSEPGVYVLAVVADDGRVVTVTELPLEIPAESITVRVTADQETTLAGPGFPVTLQFTADRILSADRAVGFSLSGDAALGEHYLFSPEVEDEIVIPEGSDTVSLQLIPLANAQQPASERTMNLTITPSSGLSPSTPGMVEVTLLPYTFPNWSAYYFGGEPADEELSSPTGNVSGDGFPKLLKYALGMEPGASTVSPPSGAPRPMEVEVADITYPALSFVRPMGPNDVEYRVEVSDSLAPGSWSEDSASIHSIDNLQNGFERVVVRDNVPLAESPRRFFRLKVLLADDES